MWNASGLGPILERCERSRSGFEFVRASDCHRAFLWGALPRDWEGNLALHFFASGYDIRSADAIRVSADHWAARFDVVSVDARRDAPSGDLLAMARRVPRLVPSLPDPGVEISYCESGVEPGCIYAHVRGHDSIGLLAILIRRFAERGLMARRFSLRSEGGEVRDWFWLEPRGPVSSAPPRLGA